MTVQELMVALGYKVDDKSRRKVLEDGKALKGSLTKLLGAVGITVTLAGVIKFGKDSLAVANDLEQMEMKFNTVFGEMGKSADQWADKYAESIGRSKSTIKTYMADNQNLLVGMGMARDKATEMTEQMVTAAIDLASFNNITDDEAVNAMSKALMGETESAKRLGAVINDNTIATAMETLGLKGKFKELDEGTKMQVRYQAIMNQSQDSIGDAANSMNTYEGRLRSFNAKLKDVKENVGKFILPYATKILGYLDKGATKLKEFTDGLGDANEEGTQANRIMKAFEYGITAIGYGVEKVINFGKKFIDMVGGSENALKLLSTIVAAIMAYKMAGKILTFVQSLGSLSKVLGGINLKALAIVAAIVLLALLIEDFIGFLQGKDSLFGTLLEKAGIDVDATREKFLSFKDDFMQIIQNIKELCAPAFEDLRLFWEQYGPEIMAYLQNLANGVMKSIGFMLGCIAPFLSTVINLIKAFFALLNGDTDGAIAALKEAWSNFKEYIKNYFMAIFTFWDSVWGGLPSKALEWGRDMIQQFINGLTEKIGALKEKITGIGNTIKEKLHFSKPDNGPLADADKWMPDMMDLYSKGIEGGKAKLKQVVTGVAGMIKGVVTGDTAGGLQALVSGTEATAQTASGITNNDTRNITQNLQFNNTFNGGERDSQTQASNQMKKDAHDASTYLAHAVALAR